MPEFKKKSSQTEHQRFDEKIFDSKNGKKVVDWSKDLRVVGVSVQKPNYGQINDKTDRCQYNF